MIGGQLQRAVYQALIDVNAAGGRVYDDPSFPAQYPSISIGDEQVIDDGNSCQDGYEVVVDIHVWSRPETGSSLEAKAIGAVVVEALATELPVEGFATIFGHLETSRYFREADGKTVHGVVSLRYLLEPMEN